MLYFQGEIIYSDPDFSNLKQIRPFSYWFKRVVDPERSKYMKSNVTDARLLLNSEKLLFHTFRILQGGNLWQKSF
jgi:hypothetical protein